MSADVILVVVVVLVLSLAVAVAALAAYLTAHRLDRLHIRTDLARTALVGALERRHTVAAAIVGQLGGRDPDAAARLADALVSARSRRAESVVGVDPAPDPDRRSWPSESDPRIDEAPDAERAENTLGTLLARVDTASLPDGLIAELADVSDRVAMARRFYNDAVRDTRRLREKAGVRALRLAGRAPMPDYVELVDHPAAGG